MGRRGAVCGRGTGWISRTGGILELRGWTLARPILFNFLVAYECRRALLTHLSAYDIAKLDLVLKGFLTPKEKLLYLDPTRDLIWNVPHMRSLLVKGMNITALGTDLKALQLRVQDLRKYLRSNKASRRLKIYLIGTFPILKTPISYSEEMIRFNINGNPNRTRILKDRYQLKRMRQAINPGQDLRRIFVLSFGLPTRMSVGEAKGSWHLIQHIPDCTIDLRVYVPCYEDRMWGEVRISPVQFFRIYGCSSNDFITTLKNTKSMISGMGLEKAALTSSGLLAKLGAGERQLLARIGIFFIGYLC
ncbi:hypothetical protein IQ07DRAFT_558117 [Pyrenochaeta sp. DS3sAY3a]|nr:hypothetical protein IQ07DRAFT_558117 [Pyrenochaeta sp. DS3sAY3a]